MPDFARAHAILAIVYLINREMDKAEQELALAERLEPSSPVVAMYWSQFYLSQAKYEEAISKALDAVRFSDESVSSLIGLAQVYKATARFNDMRATLDRVYKLLDAPGIVRELKTVFQYDPEEAAEQGEDGDDTAELGLQPDQQDPSQGGQDLKLGEGLGGSLGSGKRLNIDLNLK
jgi:tetratricopeptide (TPR) repeat protein